MNSLRMLVKEKTCYTSSAILPMLNMIGVALLFWSTGFKSFYCYRIIFQLGIIFKFIFYILDAVGRLDGWHEGI